MSCQIASGVYWVADKLLRSEGCCFGPSHVRPPSQNKQAVRKASHLISLTTSWWTFIFSTARVSRCPFSASRRTTTQPWNLSATPTQLIKSDESLALEREHVLEPSQNRFKRWVKVTSYFLINKTSSRNLIDSKGCRDRNIQSVNIV